MRTLIARSSFFSVGMRLVGLGPRSVAFLSALFTRGAVGPASFWGGADGPAADLSTGIGAGGWPTFWSKRRCLFLILTPSPIPRDGWKVI